MANLQKRIENLEDKMKPEKEEFVTIELVYKNKLTGEIEKSREIETDIPAPRKVR